MSRVKLFTTKTERGREMSTSLSPDTSVTEGFGVSTDNRFCPVFGSDELKLSSRKRKKCVREETNTVSSDRRGLSMTITGCGLCPFVYLRSSKLPLHYTHTDYVCSNVDLFVKLSFHKGSDLRRRVATLFLCDPPFVTVKIITLAKRDCSNSSFILLIPGLDF